MSSRSYRQGNRAALANARFVAVEARDEAFVYRTPIVSRQTILLPGGVSEPSQRQWRRIHDGFDRGLLVDASGEPVGAIGAILFDLVRASDQPHEVAFDADTRPRIAGEPDLPIRAVRVRYHVEERPLDGDTAPEAFARLATLWLMS